MGLAHRDIAVLGAFGDIHVMDAWIAIAWRKDVHETVHMIAIQREGRASSDRSTSAPTLHTESGSPTDTELNGIKSEHIGGS